MVTDSYSLDLVIPCYQEEAGLPTTITAVLDYLHTLQQSGRVGMSTFRVLLVDDGSKDRTWATIAELSAAHGEVHGLKLSRNYGHQSAMLAGLSRAEADAVITMDADLQDDISAIEKMLLEYQAGSDLVLGVRDNRDSDTHFKRNSANGYYWLLAAMGVNIVQNHADYRLTSRRALRALLAHDEVNLFLRGIIPSIGFKTALVPYTRKAREFGTTNYTLSKMLGLAINGITSFSVAPLRMITALGAMIFVVSTIISCWVLSVVVFARNRTVPGWASTLLPILTLGGAQLLSLGVIGEYIGKIYLEVKRRPRFIIEESL